MHDLRCKVSSQKPPSWAIGGSGDVAHIDSVGTVREQGTFLNEDFVGERMAPNKNGPSKTNGKTDEWSMCGLELYQNGFKV